ncbi:hypothetical protein PanWU01x14_144680 [Parasponia andersonii]|uniref:Uncharacterized protein n=1 Tax=Parasponia andersonii TaxID=3476 RepID=A0A2P5CKG9_PARAD|nr:hypothetical protein PanWU01x14_144680 [Parasponia andersonii]
MEGREAQTKNEALKSHLAIRCGKAAILLSSLKTSRCRRLNLNQIMVCMYKYIYIYIYICIYINEFR